MEAGPGSTCSQQNLAEQTATLFVRDVIWQLQIHRLQLPWFWLRQDVHGVSRRQSEAIEHGMPLRYSLAHKLAEESLKRLGASTEECRDSLIVLDRALEIQGRCR